MRLALIIFLLTAFTAAFSHARPLTPQEKRGKHIYVKGTSPAGRPITSYFGKDLIEMPGERATCTSCHGYDGLGRPESGVIPTNVTWDYMMKSYGHIHPTGVEHAAFTEESLKSYMRDGIYPGGVKGDPSMPVYVMADEDLDDLIAYLKIIGAVPDPGISDDAVRVWTVVPSEGPPSDTGEAMRKTIEAYFSSLNEKGGIFGRKVELQALKIDGSASSVRRMGDMFREGDVFALLSPFSAGLDTEIAALAETEEMPVVGPFTLYPIDSASLNRFVFYLFSGIREQSAALIDFAVKNSGLADPRAVVLAPSGKDLSDIASFLIEHGAAKGWEKTGRVEYLPDKFDAPELIRKLKGDGVEVVLFLGAEAEAKALFGALRQSEWTPYLLMPGVIAGRGVAEMPARFRDRLFLSYPSVPDDRKDWAIAELLGVLQKGFVANTHPAAQLSAYAAARVFVEGLRRAGKNLSRERFVVNLEGVFEFQTGLTPPITYNRNRRIGALGAYIFTINPDKAGTKDFLVPKGWIQLQ